MRKPVYTNATDTFKVKAKNVKKNDTIVIGATSCKVLSNGKNTAKDRVLQLRPVTASTSILTLILPKDHVTRVTTRSFVNHQK